jgi:hypothetical protein
MWKLRNAVLQNVNVDQIRDCVIECDGGAFNEADSALLIPSQKWKDGPLSRLAEMPPESEERPGSWKRAPKATLPKPNWPAGAYARQSSKP